LKLHEEESKRAGLAQGNGFGPHHICTVCLLRLVKGAAKLCSREECNK